MSKKSRFIGPLENKQVKLAEHGRLLGSVYGTFSLRMRGSQAYFS